ncbi:MAG: hypothetical protein HRJ53_18385 [Acidobacteria bacterium Pan2503]|uniref:Uncharacterized protein n=1 Tax=Candidatus Acidiferrum panamense TaxID=2741543 RepID=A0A7V8SYE2_9BACT|nr:hypothetical protein [Candidatus Acidoferrum panamensis]
MTLSEDRARILISNIAMSTYEKERLIDLVRRVETFFLDTGINVHLEIEPFRREQVRARTY